MLGVRCPGLHKHDALVIVCGMKLNFWQMVGVGLLIVGIAVYIYTRSSSTAKGPTGTTQPAAK